MSYLVLARKYRPQRFSELVGQEHVARTLSNAIDQNRVHHAFLFTGARGVGKTSAARILAKSLCCVQGPTINPCGVCDPCQEITSGRSVDIVEIDGASNTGVDDVRTLREGVRYLPAKTRLKVYIIDEVHMLSTSAFNALLKTLEEPPPHVVFIFATTEVHKIPTTILSRCQRYDFKLIPTTRLVSHLESILASEAIEFEPSALRLVARQAAGSVRDGLSLLDQVIAYVGAGRIEAAVVSEVLGVADRALLMDLARAVSAREVGSSLRILAAAVDRGVDLASLARGFLGLIRDLEVASRVSDPGTLEQLIDATTDELAELRRLADPQASGEGGGPSPALRGDVFSVLFDRWARAVDESARATAPRLLLEMALVDLCQAEPLEPLGDLLERLETLEGRLRSGGGAPAGGRSGPSAVGRPPTDRPSPGDASPKMRASNDHGAPEARGSEQPPRVVPVARVETSSPVAKPASSATESPRQAPSISASAVHASADQAVSVQASPSELWRRVRQELERRRPRVGALLANANVLEVDGFKLVLGFSDRSDVDAAERVRADIELALAAEWGTAVRFVSKHEAGAKIPAVIRAELIDEAETRTADRRRREEEARQHPLVQKAQDLFGVGIREIKI